MFFGHGRLWACPWQPTSPKWRRFQHPDRRVVDCRRLHEHHRRIHCRHAAFSLAVSPPSPALILRPSRSGADILHHFPHFSCEFGFGANDSIQLIGPPEYRPARPIVVWNIDLSLPSCGVHLKTGVPPNVIAICPTDLPLFQGGRIVAVFSVASMAPHRSAGVQGASYSVAVHAPTYLVSRLHVLRLCYMMNVVLRVPTSMQVGSVATPDRGGDQCRRAFS